MTDLVVMDTDMAMGFQGGPNFLTSIVTLSGANERRNAWWTRPRHEYNYSFTGRTPTELSALKAFFIGRRGRFRTWLLYDWLDHEMADEPIGIGDGATTEFDLIKTYDDLTPWVRPIIYIDETTLVVKVGGIEAGVGSYSSGTVTLNSPATSSELVTASCTFYVPVRFSTDQFMASADGPLANYGGASGLGAIEVLP